MKKRIWIVGGVLVLIGAGFFISRERAQEAESVDSTVSRSSHLPGADEGRRDGGDAGQGLQDAGGTGGQAGSAAPLLSDAVKMLVGLDGKEHTYPELLAAINGLDYELSADNVAALMEMLNFPNDRFPEKMRPIEINAVKNDVLDKLLRQKDLPTGLGLQMVEMAGNAENDPVWRDYCVQFMQPFYERASAETIEPADHADNADNASDQSASSAGQLKAVREAMVAALDERDSTIAGTSLIGLELLSRTHDEFDRELIVAKAAEIAADETASTASRMTALRLAASGSLKPETGNLKLATAETARMLAQTGETVLLRSAAIVTLGEVGSAEDRELLESYVQAEDRQIAAAAKMALAKMDAR